MPGGEILNFCPWLGIHLYLTSTFAVGLSQSHVFDLSEISALIDNDFRSAFTAINLSTTYIPIEVLAR